MLSKLCFKSSTSRTFSMKEEGVIHMLPISIILPFPLSSKVIFPPSIASRDVNYFIPPVMCLEQSLSKYRNLFFSLVARHTYKRNQVLTLGTQTFLGPVRLVDMVPFGTQTFLILLSFL